MKAIDLIALQSSKNEAIPMWTNYNENSVQDNASSSNNDIKTLSYADRNHLIASRPDNAHPKQITKIIFEVTKDTFLLEQYYHIREEMYKKELGLEAFSGAEDEYDRQGDIMVIRHGNEVIGGGRMNYSFPEARTSLVMEGEDFNLISLYPDLELNKEAYCEYSRLAIREKYRFGRKMLSILIERMVHHTKNKGVRYVFHVSPLIQAKVYRLISRPLNLTLFIDSVKVPQKEIYEGIPMVLARTDLTPLVEKVIYEETLVS